MSLFFVPPAAASEAGMGAGVGPSVSDFFKVRCTGLEPATGGNFKAGSFFMHLQYEDGSEGREILSVGYDGNGKPIAGLTADKAKNRTKFINGILRSFGYTLEQIAAGGYDEGWMVGKDAYVEWHCAADLGAQYGSVERWITKATYDAAKQSGRKPTVSGGASAGGSRPADTGSASAAAGVPRPPAPPTGGPAPAAAAAPPRPPAPPTAAVN